MGLFDAMRGGFEKLEKKGDLALERSEPFAAYGHFRDAHKKAAKKDPLAAERLKGKIEQARQWFVREKLAEAAQFLADEIADAALDAVRIARQYLQEGDRNRLAEAERIETAALELLEPRGGNEVVSRAQESAGLPDLPEEGPATVPESEQIELDAMFDQFAGALDPDDQKRAAELGAAFRAGFVAHQLGRNEEALEALCAAEQEHGDDAMVLEHLALALDQLNRTEEAAETYRRALDLDPTRTNARIALAAILAGVEPSMGARSFAHWQREITARATAVDETIDAALALLEEGARRDPARSIIYLIAAAELSLAVRRTQSASGLAVRAMEAAAEEMPSLWHLHGVTQELLGDLEDAEESYERAVQLGGRGMFFRAEFAEFALRHGRALENAEQNIVETCIGCVGGQPSPDELDYYGVLLIRLQHARGELRPALDGIDRLLKKGCAPIMEENLRALRQVVVRELAVQQEPEQ